LGLSIRPFMNRLARMKERGIDVGGSPMNVAVPPGFTANATSTLHGPEGEIRLQWIKAQAQAKSPQEWARCLKDEFADLEPVKLIKAPTQTNCKLLTVYPIGDHHLAQYSYGEETGADYDMKIARRLLVSAVSHLVDVSPASEEALIINLGDFFHVDNPSNTTPASGHTLDVDTRYSLAIKAGVAMLRTCIDKALGKHKRVKVICTPGNHDPIGALWLSLALKLCYEANPRVIVETQPGKFHYTEFGKVLIGVTHGDNGKPEKLQGVMAVDQAEAWGRTEHRYWFTGHVHHRKVIEFPGVMWETFRTLAARDAWATSAGFRSGRDMTSITFSRTDGEVCRHTFNICMLEP
jgi:hypothetical protein